MKAITVVPGDPASAELTDVAEPSPSEGAVLVATTAVGICGTDREIVEHGYGEVPPGERRLIVGHESVGHVLEAPSDSGFVSGDLVVGIVRAPDPVPCECCRVGQWDMCRNGLFTERGIRGRHGFGRERFRIEPYQLIKVDPALGGLAVLLEPTSVVAKAWEQIHRIGRRACFEPKVAVVTGAGPIGLLAALLSVQQGLDTHVVDRVTDGPKPQLVRDLGATYHSEAVGDLGVAADIVVECTAAGQVAIDVMRTAAPNVVMALVGISMGTQTVESDRHDGAAAEKSASAADAIDRALVLTNSVVFGSVNAAYRHYEQGAAALSAADPTWLGRLLTRRAGPAEWPTALSKQSDDIKVVVGWE